MALAESKLTTKGQITVPRAVREALGLRPGDHLEWRAGPDGVVHVRKLATRTLDDLVGLLGRPPRTATIEDMDAAIRQRFRDAGR